eukprot:g17240.t1
MAATLLSPASLPSDEGALTLKTAVLIAAVVVAVSLEGLRKLGIVTGVSSCTPWSCSSSAAAGQGGGGEEVKEGREAQDQDESDHAGNARRNPSAKASASALQRQQLLHDTAARVNAMGHRLRDGVVVKLVGNRSAVAVSSPCAAGSASDHAPCEARTLAIAGERVAFATVRDRAEFLLTMKVLNQQGVRQRQLVEGNAAAAHVQRGCAPASKAYWAGEAA